MAVLLELDKSKELLGKLSGWALSDPPHEITKTFVFKDFAEALRFVNQVGALAEGMNHHPDILIHSYKKVTLTLTTHEAKTEDGREASGLTRMDFDLAARIEKEKGRKGS